MYIHFVLSPPTLTLSEWGYLLTRRCDLQRKKYAVSYHNFLKNENCDHLLSVYTYTLSQRCDFQRKKYAVSHKNFHQSDNCVMNSWTKTNFHIGANCVHFSVKNAKMNLWTKNNFHIGVNCVHLSLKKAKMNLWTKTNFHISVNCVHFSVKEHYAVTFHNEHCVRSWKVHAESVKCNFQKNENCVHFRAKNAEMNSRIVALAPFPSKWEGQALHLSKKFLQCCSCKLSLSYNHDWGP